MEKERRPTTDPFSFWCGPQACSSMVGAGPRCRTALCDTVCRVYHRGVIRGPKPRATARQSERSRLAPARGSDRSLGHHAWRYILFGTALGLLWL